MRSHELAKALLERDDAPIVFQAGHDMEEGDLLPDVLELSPSIVTGDAIVLIEIGDTSGL